MTFTFDEVTDRKVWELFYYQYGPNSLFQSWEWGEVQKKIGNTVERFGIWKSKELVGIFQSVKVIAKRGSFLHIRHGPILKDNSTDTWKNFTYFASNIAKKHSVLFFRISPLITPEEKNSKLLKSLLYHPAAIHAMDAELCWVLPLVKTSEILLQEMRKTTRYEIRRAEKLGVTVESSENPDDLKYFFDLYDQTAERHKFVPHLGIKEEFEIFTREKKALLYSAKFEKKVIASAVVLFVGNQGIYHHGASVTSSVPGSYLIQWVAINEAKNRGKDQYNFWGIAPEGAQNHPWKGITLFKKGFGGAEKKYLHAHDFPVSPLYIFPRTVETIRRLRKGY